MKKILLGTTGLVGAMMIAAAASAETPKVTLGGFSDFQAGWADNDAPLVGGDGDSSIGFRNDNEITIHVDGKTDAGLGYGVVIDLEADLSADNNNEGLNASRTFTYLEGTWGRVEMGGNKSVASTMRVDASTVAVATGGINGDWVHFVNPTGATTNPGDGAGAGAAPDRFITNSELQTEHGSLEVLDDETTYNTTKVSYYTPRWSGFQAGVSYAPDLEAKGQLAQRVEDTYTGIWDLGVGYETQFDGGIKLALSGTYETADSENAGVDDLTGWNVGALLGWDAWSLAASYGDWEGGFFIAAPVPPALGVVTPIASVDGDYWTAGAAYDGGAWGLSATYLNSNVDDTAAAGGENEFSNFVLGADYKLAPGLTPYVEASFYEFDAEGAAAADNEGHAIIVGTQVAF